MAKFEKVSKYKAVDINMPVRKTAKSAGYDFEVIEEVMIDSYSSHSLKMSNSNHPGQYAFFLDDIAELSKELKARPTLVPTGMKCKLADDEYLELSIRSSCPLKHWLILANGVGIIDSDYYNNPDNEGEIFFQIINLSPFPILLKKGDIVGQGIIHKYITTEDDVADGERLGGFGSTTKGE